MGGLFNYDGPVVSFLNRLADLVILNLIFILCCIPVFTIGASLTALSTMTMKMVKKEEGYIARGFFTAFKRNFRQATVIWMILLILGSIFCADFWVLRAAVSATPVLPVIHGVLILLFVLFLMEFLYVFPVLAKFDNTIKNTMKNAILMSIRHLPWTLVLVVIAAAAVVVSYIFLAYAIPVLCLLGFSVISLISAYVFTEIFKVYVPAEE
ncbi:Uncharacterized membrane protein YesL [Lachnospiraceae bacterium]|nr:Uncharacterized membrane protein YesL [Lachnospiraceae bacterium]